MAKASFIIEEFNRFSKTSFQLGSEINSILESENKGKYGKKNWDTRNEVIKKNTKTLLELNSRGAQIVFVSARPEKNQRKLTIELKKIGFSNFKLLLDLNHSQRILIND